MSRTTVHLSERARKVFEEIKDSNIDFNLSDWVSRRICEEFEGRVEESLLRRELRDVCDRRERLRRKEEALRRKLGVESDE